METVATPVPGTTALESLHSFFASTCALFGEDNWLFLLDTLMPMNDQPRYAFYKPPRDHSGKDTIGLKPTVNS